MNRDEKRVALAKLEGWTRIRTDAASPLGVPPEYAHIGGYLHETQLPDYFGDLNALHRLENRLFGPTYFESGEENEAATRYWLELRNLQLRPLPGGGKNCSEVDRLRSSSEQRAEAIGRTFYLWTE